MADAVRVADASHDWVAPRGVDAELTAEHNQDSVQRDASRDCDHSKWAGLEDDIHPAAGTAGRTLVAVDAAAAAAMVVRLAPVDDCTLRHPRILDAVDSHLLGQEKVQYRLAMLDYCMMDRQGACLRRFSSAQAQAGGDSQDRCKDPMADFHAPAVAETPVQDQIDLFEE